MGPASVVVSGAKAAWRAPEVSRRRVAETIERVRGKGKSPTRGRDLERGGVQRLAAANAQVNYRKLPYRLGYGLRLGTSHSATQASTCPT